MIYSVRGKLIHTDNELAVVECGGVGYGCRTTFYTLQKIAGQEEVMLYTHLAVREDAAELFGFSSQEELKCFKMLITVSGVGPKAAISILSANTPSQFALAVATGDSKSLTKCKGIGAKTAQRIVLELKDKISAIILSDNNGSKIHSPITSNNISEAVKALMSLGYSSDEVMPIVSKMDSNLSIEQLIGNTLKVMSKGV